MWGWHRRICGFVRLNPARVLFAVIQPLKQNVSPSCYSSENHSYVDQLKIWRSLSETSTLTFTNTDMNRFNTFPTSKRIKNTYGPIELKIKNVPYHSNVTVRFEKLCGLCWYFKNWSRAKITSIYI